MISEKVKDFSKKRGGWFDDASKEYQHAFVDIGIEKDTDISLFYADVEDGPTFYSRKKEIYHLGWYILNSDYKLDLDRCHNAFGLSKNYISLDSFEGEAGFFYNKENGEVFQLSLGQELQDFKKGHFKSKWKNFNYFIEWFFEI